MIKIALTDEALKHAQDAHLLAIQSYVARQSDGYLAQLFADVTAALPQRTAYQANDWSWLRDFILATPRLLFQLIQSPDKLQFGQFLKLYNSGFCNGSAHYMDDSAKYNAYTFIQNVGIEVCPYCEEEYLDVLKKPDGATVRTLEIDHFYPKGKFPALALCFYNLVPSGQNCNGLKKQAMLGMSPYEQDIESHTWLNPDIPVGSNMENVSVDDCTIHFHPRGGMRENVETLLLEQRYEKYKSIAHRYLLLMQQYNDAKVEEMVRSGYFPSADAAYRILYGEPLADDNRQKLLQKLKRDMTGRR